MKKNTIAFIPARSGSKRIKAKNLQKINGKSLVFLTAKQALNTKIFQDIYLSSDSKKILDECKDQNIKILKRRKNLSKDKSLIEEVLIDFLNCHNIKARYLVLMQPTSPLRSVNTIKKFIKFCLKNKLKKCLTVSEIHDQISEKKNKFKSLSNYKVRRTQERKIYLFENSLLYFVDIKYFLKTKTLYEKNWSYYITNKYESLDINNKEDLEVARKLMKNENYKNK